MLRQLSKDTVKAYQFFSIARKGGLLLLGIYLARSSWTLDNIGHWEGLLFSVTLFGSFWLESWVKTYLTSVSENEDKLIAAFRWVVKRVVIFSVSMGLLWWIGQPLWEMFLIPYVPKEWTWLFILFSVCWMPTLLLPAHFLSKDKAVFLWSLGIYYLIAFPVSFILFDLRYPQSQQSIYGLLIWVFPLLVLLVKEYLYRPATVNTVDSRGLWMKWRMLLVYSLLAVLAPLVDSWLVQFWYADPATFAIFRYGARELPLVGTLAAGLSTAMIPAFSRDWNGSLEQLKIRINRLLLWLYPPIILLLIFAPLAYVWVFTRAFIESSFIFQIYLLLIASQLIIVQPIILAKGKERWLVDAAIGELITNLFLSLVLGFFFGIAGIAWATVIAFLYEKVYLIIRIKRNFGVGMLSYYPRWGILMTILLVLFYILSYQLNDIW